MRRVVGFAPGGVWRMSMTVVLCCSMCFSMYRLSIGPPVRPVWCRSGARPGGDGGSSGSGKEEGAAVYEGGVFGGKIQILHHLNCF